MRHWRKLMGPIIATIILAGCGHSGPNARQKRFAACHADNVAWVTHYLNSLPGPVPPRTIANLVSSGDRLCTLEP